MHIALCHDYINPQRGGCETYIVDLGNRLVLDGHQVTLIAQSVERSRLHPAVQVRHVEYPKYPRFLKPYRYTQSLRTVLEHETFDLSIGFDKCWGVDVLFPQGGLYSASARANLRKERFVLMRLLRAIATFFDIAKQSYLRIERIQYFVHPPLQIIVNSEMTANHFVQGLGIPRSRISVIHSAISQERFQLPDRLVHRCNWRKLLQIDPTTPVGLFLATNYHLKGLYPLIHALRYLPDHLALRVVVAGNNRYSSFARLARRLNVADRIHFVGHCSDSQQLYFASDFLIHPTFYDPCSLVALEAIYCGLPVITSTMNGARELLDPMCSHIIDDPHQHRQLAHLIAACAEPHRLAAAQAAAWQTAQRWTFEHHYQRLLAVLNQVYERKRYLLERAA